MRDSRGASMYESTWMPSLPAPVYQHLCASASVFVSWVHADASILPAMYRKQWHAFTVDTNILDAQIA